MLEFLLNNVIFDYIIIILLFINFLLTITIDLKEQKKELKCLFLLSRINQIKIGIMLVSILIVSILIYINFSNLIRTIIYFIIPAILLIKNIFNTYRKYRKNQVLSIDDKYYKLWSIYIFFIFFSAKAIPIYYNFLSSLNHNIKEILLIIYLLMKVILFTFFFLTNIAILLSNLNILKPFNIQNIKSNDIYYKFKNYDFILYQKTHSKLMFTIDILIYFLLSIPTIIYNLIIIICLKIFNKLKLFKNYIIKIIYKFNDNSNRIIRKITNISIIVAFSTVHIIIIIYSSLFSDKIAQVYNFLATVILIPFIYDSIKSNHNSKA